MPSSPYNKKPSGLLYRFIILVENGPLRRFPILFIVIPFTMQDSLAICQCTFEIVRDVRFVNIKSVRIVDLVVVNVQFCIRKNGMQNIVHMSNMRHSLVLFYKFNVIVTCLSKNSVLFVLFFLFCCFVNIKTTSFN